LIKHIILSEKYALFLTTLTSIICTIYLARAQYNPISLFAGLSFLYAILLPLLWIHTNFPITFISHKTFAKKRHLIGEYIIANRYVFLLFLPFILLFLHSFTLMFSILINYSFHFISTALWFNNTGSISIPWRTGKKGNSVRRLALETGSVAVPIGSIPSQIRTIGSVITNASFVYLSVLVLDNYLISILVISLILGIVLYRHIKISYFIGNHAYFDEYFKPDSITSVPKPIQVESLYWIPKSIKTDARFILTQHIRSQSISRIHLGSHLLFWFLVLINPSWFDKQFGVLFLGIVLIAESLSLIKKSIIKFYSIFLVKSFFKIFSTHLFCMTRWMPAYLILIAYSFSFSSWIFWIVGILILVLTQIILSFISALLLKQFSTVNYV